MSGYIICNPACKFFRCAKNALSVKPLRAFSGSEVIEKQRKLFGTSQPFILWCNWVNDVCIGYQCNYAICQRRAILTDGKCGLTARETHGKKKRLSIEEEALKEEYEIAKISSLLKRKGIFYEE